MPYTAKQKRLFQAAEHNAGFARKVGIPQGTARKLAHEAASMPTRRLVRSGRGR